MLQRALPLAIFSALSMGWGGTDPGSTCAMTASAAARLQRGEFVAAPSRPVGISGRVHFASVSGNEITPSFRHLAHQQTVGTHVTLSNRPYALAINDRGIMYAPRLDAASAARFDWPARDPTAHVGVGTIPTDVSFDRSGSRAFVSNQGGSVSVIDVASNTVSQTIAVRDRAFVSLTSPNDERLYVGSAIGKVYVYHFGLGRFTDSITVGDVPQHLTFSPDGVRLYVSMRDLGRVAEVDTRTNSVVRTFNSTYGIQEAVVAPDGCELYVANQSGWLEVWNLGTGAKTQEVALGDGPWALTLSPDGSKLYAGILFSGEVAVIDRATRAVERYIDVGGIPRRIKFAPDNTTIVIANEAGYVTFIP